MITLLLAPFHFPPFSRFLSLLGRSLRRLKGVRLYKTIFQGARSYNSLTGPNYTGHRSLVPSLSVHSFLSRAVAIC